MIARRPVSFRTLLTVLLALGLVMTVAAGCGGEPTEAPEPPQRQEAGELPTTEPEPTEPAPALIFGHPEDATKLDPSDVTDGESLLVTWHIYEGLTRYQRGTTEIEPALATDWETSEDGLEWTFNLRQGVKFHDGTDFNADAVVWNFQRWFDEEHPYHFEDWDFAYWSYMFQGYKGQDDDEDGEPDTFFESIEKIDDDTVQINLRRPNAPLLQNLAMGNFGFSSPAAVESAGSSYGTPDGNPIAAGTGPYMVEEWVVQDNITLTEFPDYWGDAPQTSELVFRVIPDGTARFLSLANGEIDAMNQVNPEDIENAESDENINVVFEPANNVGYLGINQAHAPWDNRNCRLALAHAINKQGVVDTLYAGDAEPAKEMMPPSLWGYNEDIEDYAYDLDLAQDALDTCLTESSLPEEVVFYVPPIQRFYYPKPKELGELVQSTLAGLDITTSIQSPDWGNVWLPDVREGKAHLFLLGWGGDNGDPDNFLCQFFCGGDASFNSDAEGNPAPPNEELNTLLREAASLSDQAEREALYEQANQIVHDDILAVPIVHRSPPLLFRANVTGYTPSPIQTMLTGVEKTADGEDG